MHEWQTLNVRWYIHKISNIASASQLAQYPYRGSTTTLSWASIKSAQLSNFAILFARTVKRSEKIFNIPISARYISEHNEQRRKICNWIKTFKVFSASSYIAAMVSLLEINEFQQCPSLNSFSCLAHDLYYPHFCSQHITTMSTSVDSDDTWKKVFFQSFLII